jgi:hypothetical protein
MAYMLIPAFDPAGIKRLHKLEEGDIIEWTTKGHTSPEFARVTCLYPERDRPIRIMALNAKLEYAGSRQKWITSAGVRRVMDPRGNAKGPHEPPLAQAS